MTSESHIFEKNIADLPPTMGELLISRETHPSSGISTEHADELVRLQRRADLIHRLDAAREKRALGGRIRAEIAVRRALQHHDEL